MQLTRTEPLRTSADNPTPKRNGRTDESRVVGAIRSVFAFLRKRTNHHTPLTIFVNDGSHREKAPTVTEFAAMAEALNKLGTRRSIPTPPSYIDDMVEMGGRR